MSSNRDRQKSDLTASLQNRSNTFSTLFSNKKIIAAIVNQLDLWVVACKPSSEKISDSHKKVLVKG